jgi:hypothetical protein
LANSQIYKNVGPLWQQSRPQVGNTIEIQAQRHTYQDTRAAQPGLANSQNPPDNFPHFQQPYMAPPA